ncbi:SpoIID/LytB domain-containing protein [Thermaerobacter litoralis]
MTKSHGGLVSIFVKVFTAVIPILLCFQTVVKAASNEPIVSVKLKHFLGNKPAVRITVSVPYQINNNIDLSPGTEYEIKIDDDGKNLNLKKGQNIIAVATSFRATPAKDSGIISINGRSYIGTIIFEIENGHIRPVNLVPLEEYIKGVVPEEMYPNWPIEALKAQAVAARTYALRLIGKVIDDSDRFQVYGGYKNGLIKSDQAVDQTRGQVLTYKGKLIEALYSAYNGGQTESNSAVWGGDPLPYFIARKDPYDPGLEWSIQLNKFQIKRVDETSSWDHLVEVDRNFVTYLKKLVAPNYDIRIISFDNVNLNTDGTIDINVTLILREEPNVQAKVGMVDTKEKPLNVRDKPNGKKLASLAKGKTIVILGEETGWYKIAYGDSNGINYGYVSSAYVRMGVKLQRETFIDNVLEPYLRSSLVNLQEIKEDVDSYHLIGTRRYGHGVGMSQWGAYYRARQGQSYEEILAFYYPGTQISNIYGEDEPEVDWFYVGGGLYMSEDEANVAAQKFTRLTGYKIYTAPHPSSSGFWVRSGRITAFEKAKEFAAKWSPLGLKYVLGPDGVYKVELVYYVGGGLFQSQDDAADAAARLSKLTGYKMYVAPHPELNGFWVRSGRVSTYEQARRFAEQWLRYGLKYVYSSPSL